jgi:hypothetical protein
VIGYPSVVAADEIPVAAACAALMSAELYLPPMSWA